MRFFAHDGKTVHGPAVLDELLRLPGFDGDTLVCPVGSENSSDWKPALAYPSFREALLAPAPKAATPPPPPPPPAPMPMPTPTAPCPRCGRANPEDARFCNGCASRMDGREELPAPAPAPASEAYASPAPEPVSAFAHHPELVAVAEQPAPAPEFTSFEPVSLAPDVSPLAEESVPAAAAAPAPASSTWRRTLIASFAGAALASGGLGWWLLRPAKRPMPSVADLVPAAPAPAPVVPETTAAATLTPAPSPAPTAPAPKIVPKPAPAVDLNELTKAPAVKPAAKRARRARKPKPAAPAPEAAASGGETLIESHDKTVEPSMPGSAAAAPPAAPAAEEDRGFLLPGVPRRTGAPSVTKPKAGAAPAAKTDAASAAPAPAADAAEDGTTKQVREQFVFCAQLLAQGAFADHFDTCLCADARQAAPYHGRRGYYATAMKKSSSAGTLMTSAAVKGIVLDGPVAKVTADWRTDQLGTPRTETETWQLEDGLWCRFP